MLIPSKIHIFQHQKRIYEDLYPLFAHFLPNIGIFGIRTELYNQNLYYYESLIPRTFLVVLISQHTDVSSAKNDGPMRGGFLGNRS